MHLLLGWYGWLEAHLFILGCLGSLAVILAWLGILCLHLGSEITRAWFGRP